MQNNYTVEEIALADIDLDRGTQVRASVDEETICRYFDIMVDEEARDKFPPAVLFRDENGKLWLADGHHRVMAALRRKFHSILAIVRPGSKADAIWEAAKANSRNGLPLGRADLRRAVIMILETFPNKSTTAIAEAVGCSQQYVARIKGQVTTGCNLTEPAKVEGKDGKMYSSRRKSISITVPYKKAPMSQRDEPIVEPSIEELSSPPMPDAEAVATCDPVVVDSHLIEASVKRTQIHDTISQLEIQLTEWFAIAPQEQYKDFDRDVGERLRALCR